MMQSASSWIDQFGRQKRKLRISVTDRCNFKCLYCMPEHPEWMKKHQILSFEALFQFCQFMVQNGIEYIRITGGEPLMRQGVVHFVAELQKLKKIVKIKKITKKTQKNRKIYKKLWKTQKNRTKVQNSRKIQKNCKKNSKNS